MPTSIVEVFAFKVAPSIARIVAGIWLNDSSLIADSTVDMVELVMKKTGDPFASKTAQDQMNTIGRKIAQQLSEVYSRESHYFKKSSTEVVAETFALVISDSKIDLELLYSQDLQPKVLTDWLIRISGKHLEMLSESEESLYRILVSEASQYIIDVASEFPAFTEKTLGEILKRESYLIKQADRLLEEVRIIRQVSQDANKKNLYSRFETEYLRSVTRKLDYMELFGADVSKISRRHNLSMAYVMLSVQSLSSQQDITLPVDKALSDRQFVLIKGRAGSGKTTLTSCASFNLLRDCRIVKVNRAPIVEQEKQP